MIDEYLRFRGKDIGIMTGSDCLAPFYKQIVLYAPVNDFVPKSKMTKSELKECVKGSKSIGIPWGNVKEIMLVGKEGRRELIWRNPDLFGVEYHDWVGDEKIGYRGRGDIEIDLQGDSVESLESIPRKISDSGIGLELCG